MATRRELEQTSFLYGGNGAFLEELYARYLADPQQVDPSWRAYFDELGPDNRQLFERARAALEPRRRELRVVAERVGAPVAVIAPSLDSPAVKALVRDHLRVIMLIRAYRVRGHLIAKLDPLGLTGNDYHPELDWRTYGFTEADLDREFYLDYVLGLEKATLRKIVEVLQRTYSGTIGIEFLHIQDPEQKAWIQARVENPATFADVTAEEKREILEQLTVTEGFEQFLHVKFPGTKRFGLDGGESAIPALETIIRTAAGLGVEEIVLGMAHRGRLNVLANVMGKPYAAILSEFQGAAVYDRFLGSGDVKYHLGTSTDRTLPDGRTIHLSLTANPSHLEIVDPVVEAGEAQTHPARRRVDLEAAVDAARRFRPQIGVADHLVARRPVAEGDVEILELGRLEALPEAGAQPDALGGPHEEADLRAHRRPEGAVAVVAHADEQPHGRTDEQLVLQEAHRGGGGPPAAGDPIRGHGRALDLGPGREQVARAERPVVLQLDLAQALVRQIGHWDTARARRPLEEMAVPGDVAPKSERVGVPRTDAGFQHRLPAPIVDAIVEGTETGATLRAHRLRIVDELLVSTPRWIANRRAYADPWKRSKMENLCLLLQGALSAEGMVGLKMNLPRARLPAVLEILPAMRRPTVSSLADEEWVALEVMIEERRARDLIPELRRAGAEGIVEYPLTKVIP